MKNIFQAFARYNRGVNETLMELLNNHALKVVAVAESAQPSKRFSVSRNSSSVWFCVKKLPTDSRINSLVVSVMPDTKS